MKKLSLLSILAIISLVSVPANATTVTGFGTGQFTETFTDFTSTSQTPTYYEISGTDLFQSLFGTFTPVAVPNTTPQLQLAALKTSGTATSNFQIVFYDSLGSELSYQGTWTDLPNGVPSVATLNFLSSAGPWNGTAISLGLYTAGGPPGDSLTVQLDNLSAVPEPGTLALLGFVMAGGLVAIRRRRVSLQS